MNKDRLNRNRIIFHVGDELYFTAFLKQDKTKFYVCKGIIDKVPGEKERQLFRIKIIAVANKAIGYEEEFSQSSLIGRIITKQFKELHIDIPFFMKPSEWITIKK